MHILHYTLGLPPFRSGGLAKYATDLMVAQSANGDNINLLYPGDYTFWRLPEIRIVNNESFNSISVYEIKNPIIVPLQYGVRNPSVISENKQTLSFDKLEKFYNEVKPEILHIHTLMGIPPELIIFLKEKGVKIIFTSHDYFGLCLKTNFVNQDNMLCTEPNGYKCAVCNFNAPSSLFIKLRNSKYLLRYKKMIPAKLIDIQQLKTKSPPVPSIKKIYKEQYVSLIEYYKELFILVDKFHFNSNVAKEVFLKFISPRKSVVLPLSHLNIKDTRTIKKFDNKKIRMAFIGNLTTYKGFPMLKKVLCNLNKSAICNWSLQVWWGGTIGIDKDCDKILYRGKYSPDKLDLLYKDIDLLVVPSLWKETFSLITIEAISYGVPVLVSNNVGAKDIVSQYNSDFIFSFSEENLYENLSTILNNSKILEDYNQKICSYPFEHSFSSHTQKIKQLYDSIDGKS